MGDRYTTLTFNLSNDDLAFVVGELEGLQPATLYRQAWQVFNDEWKRRQEKGHPMPMPIQLSFAVFDELPTQVKARLKPCRVP